MTDFPNFGLSPVPSLPDGRVAVVSSGWGQRNSGFHYGLDIMFKRKDGEPTHGPNGTQGYFMPDGLPAISPLDGVVTSSNERFTGYGLSRGWGVTIANGPWEVFINHLVKGTQRVTQGQHVSAGDILGEIGGSVGNQGHDAVKHIHMGLSKDDQRIDPEAYFKKWGDVPLASLQGGGDLVMAIALGLATSWAIS